MKPEHKRYIVIFSLSIAILGSCVYANSLDGEFIWDDYYLIQHNAFIRDISYIDKIFSESIFAGAGRKGHFYRPLQALSYMLDYYLWELNERGYHLTNTLLHILVALSISWFIYILYDDWLLSSLTGILFVIHPIHTEAVAYISGRADSLGLLFMLLSFIFYLKYIRLNRKTFFILTLLSYIAALLSRESSLIFPVLVILYHYTFRKKLDIRSFLPIVAVAFFYILLRFTALRPLISDISSTTNLFQRIPGFFVAITDYIRLIFLPFGLHMEYGDRVFSIIEPKAIGGVLILGFLLFYAFKKRDTNRLGFFSVLWFLLAVLPQSNIYPINAYMAEHWLYMPSIGFFLILAGGLSRLCRTENLKMTGIALVITLVVSYSFLTIRQNNYWRKPSLFYEKTLRYAPDNARIYNNLGIIYYNLGKKEDAINLYKKAIEIRPEYAETYTNLGNAYAHLGEKEDAINLYKKAIEMNPHNPKAYNNLGNVYADMGKSQEAIASYKKAIEINPLYAEAYNNLAIAYDDIGKGKEAVDLYKKSIKINPHYAQTYSNLGNAYYNLGRNQEAILSYKKAVEINPRCAEAYKKLGIIHTELGEKNKAIGFYKKAVEIDPNYISAYNNLAMAYYKLGKHREAVEFFEKVTRLDADYAIAYFNLSVAYYQLGEYESSIKNCDKAVKLGHNVDPKLLELLKPYRKGKVK